MTIGTEFITYYFVGNIHGKLQKIIRQLLLLGNHLKEFLVGWENVDYFSIYICANYDMFSWRAAEWNRAALLLHLVTKLRTVLSFPSLFRTPRERQQRLVPFFYLGSC